MKNASDMTVEEFALHLQQMKDRGIKRMPKGF